MLQNIKFISARKGRSIMVIKTVKKSRLFNLIICDELRYHRKWLQNTASRSQNVITSFLVDSTKNLV